MTDHTRSSFRPDINGMRAWAVAAVVFYHFGVPGFDGGFVGVDVFFVISGFLMTGLVVKGLERKTFSALDFYTARGRRIVPALVVLCAILLALSWFVLLPPDYKKLGTHAAYALSFLSNIEFWQEAGYFDAASHEKWLLHTWSLSVEWQFYLFLPLVLRLVWRIKPGRAAQTWAVGLGLLASLVVSVWATSTQPSAAFYLLHTRAWEMLGGGLVFLLAGRVTLSVACRSRLVLLGLLSIVLCVITFDKATAWPGWRAMLPVVATMMVLVANQRSLWTTNWLAQWLGDRSYSLYLWHWPVVVLLNYFDWRDNLFGFTSGMLATLLLGHLSYIWVEATSRRWLEKLRLAPAASALACATAVTAVVAIGVWRLQGVPGRFLHIIELAAAEANNTNPRQNECHPTTGVSSPSCVYGGLRWKVIALGDSHTDALVTGIASAQMKGEAGVVQWSYSGCPYVPGLTPTPARTAFMGGTSYRCRDFIAWVENSLVKLDESIPVIIINRYAEAAMGGNEKPFKEATPLVYFSRPYERTTPAYLDEFARSITQSACDIAKRRTVYMVRPIPETSFNVPKTLSRSMILGRYDEMSVPIKAYYQRNAWVWTAQDAARDQCGIRILDPTPYLCHDGRCYASLDGRPLYSDGNHLSEFGNKLLVPMFAEVFKSLQIK